MLVPRRAAVKSSLYEYATHDARIPTASPREARRRPG
jgi:hypothetical protein